MSRHTSPPPATSQSHWPADLILHNAKIRVLDRPNHVVEAMAIKSEHILDIGESQPISPSPARKRSSKTWAAGISCPVSPTRICTSRNSANPCHKSIAMSIRSTNVSPSSAPAPQRFPAGTGCLAMAGTKTGGADLGTRAEIDAALPHHPAYLTARSLHAAWANSQAMAATGITDDTPDPPGGRIQRDRAGAPTGILFEAAMQLVADRVGDTLRQALPDILSAGQSRLWELGLTGIHEFDDASCFDALQRLREQGRLGLRIVKQVLADYLPSALDMKLHTGFGDDWIRIGNVKVFADGALGPHTAAMLAPYETEPTNLGMLLKDAEEIMAIAQPAAEGGLAMTIHAIGDRANHEVLNAYDQLRTFETARGLPHLRHRIEHLQLLHPEDIPRPARLGLVASMQPIHALSDRQMADRYWGDRVEHAYAWRSQLENGAALAFGSDAPVEDPNPFLGLYAAVTRSPLPENHHPQVMEPGAAAYTLGSAPGLHPRPGVRCRARGSARQPAPGTPGGRHRTRRGCFRRSARGAGGNQSRGHHGGGSLAPPALLRSTADSPGSTAARHLRVPSIPGCRDAPTGRAHTCAKC